MMRFFLYPRKNSTPLNEIKQIDEDNILKKLHENINMICRCKRLTHFQQKTTHFNFESIINRYIWLPTLVTIRGTGRNC